MKPASIFALTLLAAVPALAQISWVSQRSGSDANLFCSISTPCQTFSGALAKTASGGIIKALDAGLYGSVTITQPITIDGNGVGAAIEVTSSGVGVNVQNIPGPVEIRNLAIHLSASCGSPCYGIFSIKDNVIIENVSITGAPSYGVYVNGGTATIHGVTVTGAGTGIEVDNGTATISDSSIRYSNGGIVVGGASAVTQVLIERSKMIFNGVGLQVQNAGFAATARISDCVIAGNTTGTQTFGGGQIFTFRNNAWAGNTTDGATPFSLSLK